MRRFTASRAPRRSAVYDNVVSYSGLQHFMDVPIKNYSSGMHMRLGFAIAANLDPDILLLDEIFAVGDEEFQRQCMATLQEFLASGRTIIFVSHSAAAVQAICRRVCVLEAGELQLRRRRRRRSRRVPAAELAIAAPGTWSRRAGRRTTEREATPIARAGLLRRRTRARGCSIFSGARACSRRTTFSTSDAAALRRRSTCCLHGTEPLLGIRQASRAVRRRRPDRIAEGGRRPERGHFVVNEDFDLSEVPYTFDFAFSSPLSAAAVAQQHRPVLRVRHPQAFAGWTAST